MSAREGRPMEGPGIPQRGRGRDDCQGGRSVVGSDGREAARIRKVDRGFRIGGGVRSSVV